MSELALMECIPCKGGIPPMTPDQIAPWLERLGGKWEVLENRHLHKEFLFRDFRDALAFTNRIAELAERVFHHPELLLAWGKVEVTLWTYKIGGLSETDFIFAAKVDAISAEATASHPSPVDPA
ncbi:MAG TPA: 4a-hydroxytetrahydrobiopterin dehydratase [Anaerolineales bacterium]|nr:4a-hydroxytetrahydrobiopterin dehydratase [Anaerolineales bacterium]